MGQAIRGTNGQPNVDYLDYHAFMTGKGYAASTYTNDSGLTGILAHEICHVGKQGVANQNDENTYFHREFPNGGDMYSNQPGTKANDYNVDNEIFCNDFMKAISNSTFGGQGNYLPTYGYGAVGAAGVWEAHHENIHNRISMADHVGAW